MSSHTKEEIKSAEAALRQLVKPDDRLYAVVSKISRSGMSRRIRFYKLDEDHPYGPYMASLTYTMSVYLGVPCNDDGLLVRGAGMDMVFYTSYTLAHRLFGDGYLLKHPVAL